MQRMFKRQKQVVMKTKTFPLEKSPTMEYQITAPIDQYSATTFVTKKSPSLLEFPTSPQLIFGEEIIHFSHPQHPLSMVDLPDLFNCGGCKEYGSGKRFVCQQCDYQLHDFCALAPPALKAHPFHSQHSMLFHSKPVKSGMANKAKCDVCGKPTKGCAFICTACAFQMHPCCAMLNTEFEFPNHPHTLKMMHSSSNTASNSDSSSSSSIVCGECKRKRSGKVYRCTVCDYNLHAFCAKSKINGLQANGHKPPEKPSVIAAAAKVASQVVIEFIGGFVEGLGESMGEVLVQNIAKGNGTVTNNNNTTKPRK